VRTSPGSRGWVLPTADALALTAFVLVGIRSHHDVGGTQVFARNAVPLLIVWFGASVPLRTYRRPGLRSLVVTWAVVVPVGLFVRTAWVGSPSGTRLLLFIVVGLAFTLLFLLLGRALTRSLTPRGVSRSGAERGSIPP
jgi:Protein of unknown function (DUF3054)